MLGGALNIGVTPVEAKEILYQAVAYVGIGYPRTLTALKCLDEVA
jgi:4-carboxymuconolactone decarboxylase